MVDKDKSILLRTVGFAFYVDGGFDGFHFGFRKAIQLNHFQV